MISSPLCVPMVTSFQYLSLANDRRFRKAYAATQLGRVFRFPCNATPCYTYEMAETNMEVTTPKTVENLMIFPCKMKKDPTKSTTTFHA